MSATPEKRPPFRRIATVITVIFSAAYPFLCWYGLRHWGTAPVALLLAGVVLLRAAVLRDRTSLLAALPALALAVAGGLLGSETALSLYPVLISVLLFTVFATSLSGTPVCERLARLSEPDLPPDGVKWCAKITRAWCVFFVFNGTLALITVVIGDRDLWALYNGFISYILLGLFAAGEYLLRIRHRRKAQQKSH